MKRVLFLIVAAMLIIACSKDGYVSSETNISTSPIFTNGTISRVVDNVWEVGDKVGIYMSLSDLGSSSVANAPYTVSGAGASTSFVPDGSEMIFPEDGSSVNFYAYYPYSESVANGVYGVDVSSQVFSDIDLLTASVSDKSQTNAVVSFAFTHVLSKITMNIALHSSLINESLEGLVVTIGGRSQKGYYDLATNTMTESYNVGDIVAETSADGTLSEAILIPSSAVAGSTITFDLASGETYVWDTSSIVLTQGAESVYSITLGSDVDAQLTGNTVGGWDSGDTGSVTIDKDGSSSSDDSSDSGVEDNNASSSGGVVNTTPASLGDYYYSDGSISSTLDSSKTPIGVVYYVDAGDNTKGKIVSLDESTTAVLWSLQSVVTGASDEDDGLANMAAVYATNSKSFGSDYPLFEWCHSKNDVSVDYASATTGVWYIPAINELVALYDVAICSSSTVDPALSLVVTAAGGTTFKTSYFVYYGSSTEASQDNCYVMRPDIDATSGGANGISSLGKSSTSALYARAIMAF